MKLLRGGVFALSLALATCGPPPNASLTGAVSPTLLAQPGAFGGARSADARLSGPISNGALPPRPSASYSAAPPVALSTPSSQASQGDVSLNFDDTDIRTVVDQILGSILHRNYTIDAGVQGTASLRTVTPLARSQLIPTLQTLLAQNKAVLVLANGIYRVMPADQSAASPALAGDDGLGGASIVPLRYADADQLANVLQPYVTSSGKIIADTAHNTLIVAGDPATRTALIGLIDAFDIDELAGQSYELFPVTSGDAKDFAAAFSAALVKNSNTGKPGSVTVVPLERIDAVLVIANSESLLSDAQRVYAVINQVERETVRSWHVYYVQNGRANDAAYVLQQAFTPDNITAQPTPQATGQLTSTLSSQSSAGGGGSGGATGTAGLGGSGGVGGLLGTGVTNASTAQAFPATTSTATDQGAAAGTGGTAGTDNGATGGASALLGPLSAGTASGTAATIRIIPDNTNNSLMIYATAQEDDMIDAMLSKIDIAPVEVRIDATIAEVDLNNALQYGTQFFFKSGDINAVLSTGLTSALATNFPGFVLSGAGKDAAPLAISLLQSVTKINVLSSPELMVLDGQPASLQVGNLVPYLTQTSQSTLISGAPVINSIDYRETGVILQVTPHVGSDGLVTLDVAQEVSSVQPAVTTSGINSPTFSERAVTSRVAIADGETIGLAGLIQDSDSHGNQGIPYLKDVPLLGALFGSQNNSRTRTELLVLITPHVIRGQQDADDLTADLREQLPNAAGVPAMLQSTPLGGSPDPDQYLRARASR